jgi:hypothetical protein
VGATILHNYFFLIFLYGRMIKWKYTVVTHAGVPRFMGVGFQYQIDSTVAGSFVLIADNTSVI